MDENEVPVRHLPVGEQLRRRGVDALVVVDRKLVGRPGRKQRGEPDRGADESRSR